MKRAAYPLLKTVVRGGVEPPTFRFSENSATTP